MDKEKVEVVHVPVPVSMLANWYLNQGGYLNRFIFQIPALGDLSKNEFASLEFEQMHKPDALQVFLKVNGNIVKSLVIPFPLLLSLDEVLVARLSRPLSDENPRFLTAEQKAFVVRRVNELISDLPGDRNVPFGAELHSVTSAELSGIIGRELDRVFSE